MRVLSRVRPSPLDHTYAFPSGHTTAAVFFLGALLYVILPLCAAGAGSTAWNLLPLDCWGLHASLLTHLGAYEAFAWPKADIRRS